PHYVSFVSLILHLVAAVDVDIEIIDRVHQQSHKHCGQWLASSPKDFLEEVCALQNPNGILQYIEAHQDRVRLITEEDGTVVGRAVLALPGLGDK
ncbi:hypothetical protein ACNQ25_25505, partial [Enterobacter cloacae complex sp.6730737]